MDHSLYDEEFAEDGKRRRQRFDEAQRAYLEAFFQENPYPNAAERRGLSIQLNATETSILHWFGHRRSKKALEQPRAKDTLRKRAYETQTVLNGDSSDSVYQSPGKRNPAENWRSPDVSHRAPQVVYQLPPTGYFAPYPMAESNCAPSGYYLPQMQTQWMPNSTIIPTQGYPSTYAPMVGYYVMPAHVSSASALPPMHDREGKKTDPEALRAAEALLSFPGTSSANASPPAKLTTSRATELPPPRSAPPPVFAPVQGVASSPSPMKYAGTPTTSVLTSSSPQVVPALIKRSPRAGQFPSAESQQSATPSTASEASSSITHVSVPSCTPVPTPTNRSPTLGVNPQTATSVAEKPIVSAVVPQKPVAESKPTPVVTKIIQTKRVTPTSTPVTPTLISLSKATARPVTRTLAGYTPNHVVNLVEASRTCLFSSVSVFRPTATKAAAV